MLFKSIPVSATWVSVTSLSAPKLNTAASDNSLTSLPVTTSFATESPPSVCNEPSVVDVASVASSVFIIPDEVIAPEPTVPASVTFAPLKVAAVVVPDLIIKLPDVNYQKILMEIETTLNNPSFSEYKIFDYRIKNQLILQ